MEVARLLVRDLSEEQRAAICNGCGPGCFGWLVPDLLWEEVCDQHDLDYWIGGAPRERKVADKRLLRCCLQISPWWLWATAVAYYLLIRAFGRSRWHDGVPRLLEQDLER